MTEEDAELQLTAEEAEARKKAKDEIATKYGFQSWDDAPDEALREYQRFVTSRMREA